MTPPREGGIIDGGGWPADCGIERAARNDENRRPEYHKADHQPMQAYHADIRLRSASRVTQME